MWIFLGAEGFVASCILFTGMVDDLRSKKVHNKLVLCLFSLSIISALVINGFSHSGSMALAFAASCLFIPLSLIGIFGGGDVKLLMAASPLMGWEGVLACAVLSLFWGALLGLVRSVVSGELLELLVRTRMLVKHPTAKEFSLSRIPYTVALFLAWISHLALSYYGVSYV